MAYKSTKKSWEAILIASGITMIYIQKRSDLTFTDCQVAVSLYFWDRELCLMAQKSHEYLQE